MPVVTLTILTSAKIANPRGPSQGETRIICGRKFLNGYNIIS
jgi:hypothetical protein